ncbi:cell cll lymphoma protein family member [Trichuris trichiura]|uniref:Cell cll lymphoma protein family member n=1 Tax=Trichuris trichiura TaxID=36087 RepID=A0A077Z0P4_TRITR|nr:cell cll lymphoma protein family member [Trichuris trichiura]
MISRSLRAETRNRSKEEVKRVINTIEKVRKWEKKWVMLKDSTIRVYKWVPVSESQRFGSSAIKTVTSEELSLKPVDANDLSQDGSEQQSEGISSLFLHPSFSRLNILIQLPAEEGLDSDVRTLSNFAETNEDSNAFSEGCFNSDSNQALSSGTVSAVESGATDFRELSIHSCIYIYRLQL